MKKYIPSEFESKWQKKWEEDNIYQADLSKPKNKYYDLVELPYTSGDLHMGHWFTFTMGDIVARFKRAQGFNVLFPVGYDTFGLPAENAAIKNKMHPRDWTYANIERMRVQFKTMGVSIDWDKTATTCEPEYYKWNQWIFLKMLEKGIAYRGQTISNWCPNCKTVLADENVEAGKCWRCGTEVIRKEIPQWFLKLTSFADRLLWQDPPQVDWPKPLRDAQNNWIGRSEGIVVNFDRIKIFGTKIHTIFGATFIVISPEHPLLAELTTDKQKEIVNAYVSEAVKKNEQDRKENKDKTGVFTGSYVKNPLNNEDIPVWVADYVLPGYGTGAVMGVPAHDQRDLEFAQKYNLPINVVVEPITGMPVEGEEFRKSIVALVRDPKNNKILSINWGTKMGGNLLIGGGLEEGEDPVSAAIREIKEETGYKNLKLILTSEKIHHHYTAISKGVKREIEAVGLFFDLQDQQKEKISLEKDEEGKFEVEWLSFNEAENKIKDPLHKYIFSKFILNKAYEDEGIMVSSGQFDGMYSSEAREKISTYIEKNNLGKIETQYHLHDWSISRQRYWGTPIPVVYCDQCGMVPVKEQDLPVELPYDVDYEPKGKPPLATVEHWVKVKCPKCGGQGEREVETMDGFVDNSWYFYRYLDHKNLTEIFDKKVVKDWIPVNLYIGGAEHTVGHTLYSRFFTKFFKDLGLVDFDEYALKRVNHGVILGPDGSRMSKSKGNVVNPDEEAKKFGSDAIRIYLMFLGPFDVVAPWNPGGIHGVYHFLQRVWGLQDKLKVQSEKLKVEDLIIMHKTIKKVTDDIENIKFNTSVASMMEWLNYLSRKDQISIKEYQTLLILLAPFAPHITEELWSILSQKYSIHQQSWPVFDNKYLQTEEVEIVVQVNGKVRDTLLLSKDIVSNKEVVEKEAKKSQRIQKFIDGKSVKNIVYIPLKLINFVISEG